MNKQSSAKQDPLNIGKSISPQSMSILEQNPLDMKYV